MWLDDCRIPFVDEGENTTRGKYENKVQVGIMAERPNIKFVGSFDDSAKQGRFTPNLLCMDDVLNDGVITKSGFNPKAKIKQYGGGNFGGGKTNDNGIDYGDKGSNSRYYDLDLWFDKMLERL
jgi:hypothetical protein